MTDNPIPKPKLLRQYRDAGFNFVLLRRWDEKNKAGREIGKSPLRFNWTSVDTPYENAFDHMTGGRNVGVQMATSGYCVLDYDPRADPKAGTTENAFDKILRLIGLDRNAQARVVTGNLEGSARGEHIYLKIDPEWVGRTKLPKESTDYPGVELKHGRGQQVVAAGSVHPTGGHYLWHKSSIALVDANPAPSALLEIYKREAPDSTMAGEGRDSWGAFDLDKAAAALQKINVEDYRDNDTWFDLMCSFHWMTAGAGVHDFIAWSTSDELYSGEAETIQYRWDTLKVDHTNPIRAGVFFKALKRAGVDEDEWPVERIEFLFDDIDQDDWEVLTKAQPQEATVLERMNNDHAFVVLGGKPLYLTKAIDPKSKGSWVHTFVDSKAMREKYRPRKLMVPRTTGSGGMSMREEDWFEYWSNHPKRREYEGVEFDPAGESERETPHGLVFNLFRGWPYNPDERGSGDWKKFRQLIFKAICGGNQEHLDYVLNWVAYSLQYPAGPQQIAMVLRGKKGIGKGLFSTFWTRLFGSAGLVTDEEDDVFGRFNARMETTCALFLDEALWAGDAKKQGKIKSRITETTIRVEDKFMPSRTVQNHLKIIMATNEQWAVPASTDERRFVVFDCERAWTKNHPFFKEVIWEMEKNDGLQAWFFDMMHRDISGFDPIRDYPKTDALRDQVRQSTGQIVDWWAEILEGGGVGDMLDVEERDQDHLDWSSRPVYVPMNTLRDGFKAYLGKLTGDWAYRFDSVFGTRIQEVLPPEAELRVKVKYPETEDFMDLPRLGDGRVKCYILPPLPECKEYMREMFGDLFGDDDLVEHQVKITGEAPDDVEEFSLDDEETLDEEFL